MTDPSERSDKKDSKERNKAHTKEREIDFQPFAYFATWLRIDLGTI